MNLRSIALVSSIVLLTACGGLGTQSPLVLPVASARTDLAKKARHSVYWTLYASCQYPQLQFAGVPLNKKSKAKSYDCSKTNGLGYTSGLAVDSAGRLWMLSFNGKSGGKPAMVAVFKLPLKATSVEEYKFVLSGSDGPDALTFDSSGNLWVTSPGNSSVLEYAGPFNKSKTLSPALTLPGPASFDPSGIAIDKSGNVYVSDFNSTGTNSIDVLAPPYNGTPYGLNGLTKPGGLVFDKHGNLYAASNGSALAIVRYDSKDLNAGDTPSVVDSTGIPASSYEAAFAFTATGDLYAANCGDASSAGIDVWPLSQKQFSSSLAPSVIYSTADVTQIGCAWGIAVK